MNTSKALNNKAGAMKARDSSLGAKIIKSYQLYLFLLPTLIYIVIFHYIPMYGLAIAFKNFKPHLGIWGSQWVGFEHFRRFFRSNQFWRLISNTLGLSVYQLAAGFPIPIILALALNYVRNERFKKIVQTVTYAPHFISTVVIVGLLSVFLAPQTGIVNVIIQLLGGDAIPFMARPEWFKSLYVWSGVWQNAGWGTIIYMASLAGIDPSLHEAAIVDGATKLKRMWHIDLPGIVPTIVILLIMNLGKVMSIGFEKAFLMQNSLNISKSEIISTYVYQIGLQGGQYSFSTAVGLFNSAINCVLLVTVNRISKSLGQSSLW